VANLLNVVQQAPSSKSVSPTEIDPSKLESKELKDLFQQSLSDTLEKSEEPKTDLSEVAVAAGLVQSPRLATHDQIKSELNPEFKSEIKPEIKPEIKTDVKAEVKNLNGSVASKNLQIENQLPLKTAPVQAKTVNPAMIAAQQQVNQKSIQQPNQAELASALVGQDLLMLSPDQEFDVESYELKNSELNTVAPKAAPSKISTTDFLNLREISQNQTKSNINSPLQALPLPATGSIAMGMKPALKDKMTEDQDDKKSLDSAMTSLAPAHSEKHSFGKVMDATVTQTHGQKPVLSPESMTQIGNQVNLLGQAKQDGEIKIRLRPDHLGELQMSVRTQGQNVSVQIKAENNEAKKIIEDSLSTLREHLSQQNLSLARIDVVTQTTATANLDQTQMQFDSNQNFNQSSANADRQNAQDGSQQSRREFFREDMGPVSTPTSMIRPRTADSTRLDLIA
jgi:flagellar hook-length control protein FliK